MLFSYLVHRKTSDCLVTLFIGRVQKISECKKEYLCLDLDQFSTEHVYNRF